MSSPMISNSTSDRSHRIKKKKKALSKIQQHAQEQEQRITKWRSQAQQQIYSSKLHQALARVNLSGTVPRRGKAVREAADRVLAVAAKGKTRWSRAILTNKLKLKFRKQKRHHQQRTVGPSRSKKARFAVLRLKGKTLPAVQRKVKVLARLVPGCRKEPLPVILTEVIDYIPALEMQVRAMAALADFLAGASSSAASASAFPPPS
ncbi:unnamed protein product [Vicia faba]|uniref:IBH1-like N-terminal domain-containing protein n=1 Tax=Vicia faba TaxID=3906 RepID=A0AAV0YYF7_VICFA|nr:unnamed protein product [Vicia faba]